MAEGPPYPIPFKVNPALAAANPNGVSSASPYFHNDGTPCDEGYFEYGPQDSFTCGEIASFSRTAKGEAGSQSGAGYRQSSATAGTGTSALNDALKGGTGNLPQIGIDPNSEAQRYHDLNALAQPFGPKDERVESWGGNKWLLVAMSIWNRHWLYQRKQVIGTALLAEQSALQAKFDAIGVEQGKSSFGPAQAFGIAAAFLGPYAGIASAAFANLAGEQQDAAEDKIALQSVNNLVGAVASGGSRDEVLQRQSDAIFQRMLQVGSLIQAKLNAAGMGRMEGYINQPFQGVYIEYTPHLNNVSSKVQFQALTQRKVGTTPIPDGVLAVYRTLTNNTL